MCNTSLGQNIISVNRKPGIKVENIQLFWPCPKDGKTLYFWQCRKLERLCGTTKAKVGETDCWECPNILKLRRAEQVHGDNLRGWQVALIQISVALIVAAFVILVVWTVAQHLKVTP